MPKRTSTSRSRSRSSAAAADAIASLEKAVSLDAGFAAARNQLGLLYLAQGRDADAEKQFNTALAGDPQCAECQNNLGVVAGHHGQTQRAASLFRQAIENNPDYGQARVNLALILAAQGSFPEARRELEATLAAHPNDIKTLTALGMVQGRTRDAAAVATFQKVVSLDPHSAEAQLNLGIALADQQRAGEARGRIFGRRETRATTGRPALQPGTSAGGSSPL